MASQIRVLHVDDDPEFAATVSALLEHQATRVSVTTLTDPRGWRDALDDQPIDCVLSDYEMPGLNGIGLLKAVREEHPELPFILFTGKGSEAVASDAISAGVTDYLQKGTEPELFELLVNRIEHAVEQHRIARKLDRQSELFSKTQELADVGAWEWYPEREEGFYTEQVYEIYGVEDRTGGTPDADIDRFYHPDDRETIRAAFRDAVETGEPYDLEVRVVDADGVEKWVRTRGDPTVEDGTCVRISGTIRDVTERKEREEELIRQVDRLEEFTGVVSHDLRNPLNVAQGRLDLAAEECESPHLETAVDALDRMEAIIEDTLLLARQGRTVDTTEPVAVESLVDDCWDVVESDDARLEIRDEFTVQGDRSRLSQIFENLFRNAVEHATGPSSDGPGRSRAYSATSRRPHAVPTEPPRQPDDRVTIRVGKVNAMYTTTRGVPEETFTFYVEDDGPGIPPDRRDAVFEPGESSNRDGTGFGLPIVKRIAEAHGWEVELTESTDGGARFKFANVR